MRNGVPAPPICRLCKWYNNMGCMYDGVIRESFKPEIKCFEPMNNTSYPSPKRIIRSFFNILYKSFPKMELEFITVNGGYEDGSKFLSLLSENIRLLEKFKKEFLALQKEFHEYPKIIDDDLIYLK
ncbi:MAG: hypothetical protein ACFFA4_05675 [Promethearchaeota archaeon]